MRLGTLPVYLNNYLIFRILYVLKLYFVYWGVSTLKGSEMSTEFYYNKLFEAVILLSEIKNNST